jgi:hypothetical protein
VEALPYVVAAAVAVAFDRQRRQPADPDLVKTEGLVRRCTPAGPHTWHIHERTTGHLSMSAENIGQKEPSGF